MSIRTMEQAFNTNMKPTEKLVMICLADNSNNDGVCFPSISTISQKSGLSKRAVINNINKLEDAKLLIKKYRSRKKGGRSSNKYLLFPLLNSPILSEEDYEIFKDEIIAFETQSERGALPPQSERGALGVETQSERGALESEPSLNSFNRHLNKDAFKMWCEYKGKNYKKQGKTLSANLLSKYPHDIQLQMVENSIMNNYAGLFAPKEQTSYNQPQLNSLEWERQQMIKQKEMGINAELVQTS